MMPPGLKRRVKLHCQMNTPQMIVSDAGGAAWNTYLQAHPGATLYHRYEWLGVIGRTFGHRTIPLAAVSDQHILGIFPLVLMQSRLFGRMLVSMPFVNYGGVLGDSPEIERLLWDRAVEIAQEEQASSLEARHLHSHPFARHRKEHKVGMVLSLAPTVEAQWNAFDAKLRNQIRKAELSGLTVRIGGGSDVETFYRVFARNMRDLGTPVYSRRFFDDIVNAFPDSCRLFTVHSNGTVVAGAVALAHRDQLEVPWAASRRDALSMCPNHRLYWEVIQHAIKAGYKRFDFGRSSRGGGTYKFKAQWGAKEIPLVWEYWTSRAAGPPDVTPQNPRYRLAVRLWKRLPLWIANTVGPLIVRNIP